MDLVDVHEDYFPDKAYDFKDDARDLSPEEAAARAGRPAPVPAPPDGDDDDEETFVPAEQVW
jgi:hypothetical protein